MFGLPMEPNRHIVVSDAIDERSAYQIIAQINEINEVDRMGRMSIVDYVSPPIHMYINSGGGTVTDGFAIISAMELSETPIITYGMGLVGSMALAIYVSGDIRFASRFTRFMYHSISYGMMGHITEHEEMKAEAEVLQKMYNSLMLDRTIMTVEQFEEIRKSKTNYYFGAVKATKLGIADRVIDKPEPRLEMPSDEQIEEMMQQAEEKKK